MRKQKKEKEVFEEFAYSQVLPNFRDIEEAVLGAIIIEPSCLENVASELSPELFYFNNHKIVAESIIELLIESNPVDVITICDKLRKKNQLESVGGDFFVFKLVSNVTSSANIDYHLKLLQEQALKRSIIRFSSEAVRKSFDNEADVFQTYNELQNNLENNLKGLIQYKIQSVGQIHDQIIKASREFVESGQASGVVTGLVMLDRVTNGFQKSDLIILAGRPSMGKTACAISMVLNPALQFGIPVGIFSLEMSSEQLVSRMQSIVSGVNVSKIVKKQLSKSDIDQIEYAGQVLKSAPIMIDDTANISLLELKSKCRKMVRENGVRLIIIDYLQLMRSGLYIGNREQEIAEISRGLKGLAKELDIPIIALSQLSRSVESRGGDKKPMLSDLRESGQIEQDADMVVFCYRPEYYGITDYELGGQDYDTRGLFLLLVAKHRNGELGEIPLLFVHEQTMITNREEVGFNTRINRDTLSIPQNLTKIETNRNESLTQYNDTDNLPF